MSETVPFFVNDVLLDLKTQCRYRVLWISDGREGCWWINLDTKKRIPESTTLKELEEWTLSGRLAKVEDPVVRIRQLTPHQIESRDKKYSVISWAVSQEPQIYDVHERYRILAETERQTGIKTNNLYAYIGQYWKGGKVPDALVNEERRGRCRDYTKGQYKNLGRKRRKGAPGKDLMPDDFLLFSQAIQKYYLTEDKLSLKATYDKMIQEQYCAFTDQEGEERKARLQPSGELPSFRQFQYWYGKNRDILEQVKKREGEGAYQRNSRAITGFTEKRYTYPGAAFQIDATIADIYLVKENDRNAIIGRPVMYFVMDAYTRIVTGMHITFQSPSWADAVIALDNTLTDKVEYCGKFGIRISHEEWPCMQLPSAIIADRGEMESRAADILVSSLGIRIENTPPYRGDLKGIIEQHFRLINLEMSDLLPGKVRKDFGQRGSRDYRLDAKLDIRQFTRIIIKCVLFHNNSHWMEGYRREPQMRQMGVAPVPLDLWNFGIRYRSGALVSLPRARVRYTLLPKEEASLTERGIAFRGMLYTCPEGEEENWFSKARIAGRSKLEAAYDPASTGCIYILHDDGRFLQCSRSDLGGHEGDTTFAEADADHQQDLDAQAAHSHKEMEDKAELGDFIDREIEEAGKLARQQKDPSLTKTQRLGEIGKNRQEAVRAEKAAANQGAAPVDAPSTKAGRQEEPELNAVEKLIRQQLDERLKKMEEQGWKAST